jgi:hypothetical protein
VHAELGLDSNEQILAFLYVGHPAGERKNVPALAVESYFSSWPAA